MKVATLSLAGPTQIATELVPGDTDNGCALGTLTITTPGPPFPAVVLSPTPYPPPPPPLLVVPFDPCVPPVPQGEAVLPIEPLFELPPPPPA